MQDEFKFDAGGYRCVAVRSDRPWGHGLDVKLFDGEGDLLNAISFVCHPEFPAFGILQTMNTEQLVELAANRLNTGELDSALLDVREAKLQLCLTFKITPK
ncbi:hypothetical protein [Bradyrhizobium sp. AUGA SZCCT0431]|uniref:hypothetical protein n=1 Tax=Bradyrhizobium sp. AUGA SZCCT0431 TaxID=2807674 RepID=UPI001BA7CB60|nr:hypothetical protein [Bradyrhizobium sp. AUGA SZCCT0431]MBR1145714.1 hypothetical protein [Bradyrhizobium sp. AUGA SZCCT0431]